MIRSLAVFNFIDWVKSRNRHNKNTEKMGKKVVVKNTVINRKTFNFCGEPVYRYGWPKRKKAIT